MIEHIEFIGVEMLTFEQELQYAIFSVQVQKMSEKEVKERLLGMIESMMLMDNEFKAQVKAQI